MLKFCNVNFPLHYIKAFIFQNNTEKDKQKNNKQINFYLDKKSSKLKKLSKLYPNHEDGLNSYFSNRLKKLLVNHLIKNHKMSNKILNTRL